jgi:hypothetical protein
LICDDDDFYIPDIFSSLRRINRFDLALWPDGVYGYRYPQSWLTDQVPLREDYLETISHRILEERNVFAKIKTNNYAISGKVINNFGLTSILQHGKADKFFSEIGKFNIHEFQHPMSLVNRHPCSYTVLTQFMRASPDSSSLCELVRQYAETEIRNSDGNFLWAIPSIEKVKSIFLNCL